MIVRIVINNKGGTMFQLLTLINQGLRLVLECTIGLL